MNGIKGIGFELKDGSDYEGPFPILTGQTIDLDTIQAIDYYLSLIHILNHGRDTALSESNNQEATAYEK